MSVTKVEYPDQSPPVDPATELRRLRSEARNEIDRLLEFLDFSDDFVMTERELDDADLEDGADDEPSLGSLHGIANQSRSYEQRCDRWSVDAEGDDADDEPSLGSLENFGTGNQERWAIGNGQDLEERWRRAG